MNSQITVDQTDFLPSLSKNLVVKTHRLNTVIQNLSLAEIRLIQLGIVDAREKNQGLSADIPLRIPAKRYAEMFRTSLQTAYQILIEAEEQLFDRRFSFIDEYDGNKVKSRWLSQVKYLKGEGAIEVIFTPAVVKEISRINGIDNFFTKFALEHIADFDSVYSVRLYELVNQWRQAKHTPMFELTMFRLQLGVNPEDYKRMSDFKRRVLDASVKEINKKSDLKIGYEQEKNGRTIIGFKFNVEVKSKPKPSGKMITVEATPKPKDNTINSLTDKQLARIAKNPQFISDYNHLVSPNSPANQSPQIWEAEMISRIKKDASIFDKRPILDYLK